MEAEARVRFGPANESDYRVLGFAGNVLDRVCQLCERFRGRTAACC
jgi:hypothetical protein